MIDSYGGINIFIPNKHAQNIDHEISRVVGFKQLQILSEQFGNNTIEISMGSPIVLAMHNRIIRDMVKRKESHPKIARKFGMTMFTIRTIVKGEEKLKLNEDKNYDLFAD